MVILMMLFGIQVSLGSEYLFDSLTVENLYVEGHKHILSNRTPLLKDNEGKNYSLLLGLDVNLGKYLYSRTEVGGFADKRQFRHVYLDVEKGYKPYKDIEIFIRHMSGHSLDYAPDVRFPEDNSIGVRIYLLKGDR